MRFCQCFHCRIHSVNDKKVKSGLYFHLAAWIKRWYHTCSITEILEGKTMIKCKGGDLNLDLIHIMYCIKSEEAEHTLQCMHKQFCHPG